MAKNYLPPEAQGCRHLSNYLAFGNGIRYYISKLDSTKGLTMPRKSAAALAIVPFPSQERRPDPPDDLTPDQAAIWTQVTSSLPRSWFPPETHALLANYCRHVANANSLAKQIDKFNPRRDVDALEQLLRHVRKGKPRGHGTQPEHATDPTERNTTRSAPLAVPVIPMPSANWG